MFKGLFGKKEKPTKEETRSPQEKVFFDVINEKKKTDPLIGMKLGSKEINTRLLSALKNEKGVHIESLLGVLGSLAGYSCHAAFREMLVDSGKHKENEVFTVIECKDGKKYYFGDLPNKPLAEGQVSIWGSVAGMLQHLGEKSLPDIKATFAHVSNTIGGGSFGIPQIPDQNKPNDLPINYVKAMWKPLLPIMDKFCDSPMERPVLLGIAAQQAIEMGKEILHPNLAGQLVMECAIPMSKIGPEWLE
ncbi:MAG: hypothetical protein VW877_04170 [Pseudomonadaceae bacterium]